MNMEQAISGENPSSCHKKKKRERRETDKYTEANRDCVQESFSVKNTPVDPPVVVGTTLDPLIDATSEKKERRKSRKKRSHTENLQMNAMDHERTVLAPEKVEATDLEPSANVTLGKKKRKGKCKRSDDRDMTNGDNQGTLWFPTKAEATDLDPTADRTPGKKKKTKRSNHLEVTTMVNESTLLVPTKLEASMDNTNNDPTADVASGKKKKKKKIKQRDDLEMKNVDNQSTSLVPAKVEATEDATNRDPTIDAALRQKKKKRKAKRSDHSEIKTMENESILLAPTKAEPAEAANLDPMADVTQEEKKKKKKTKRSDNLEIETVASKSIILVQTKAEATSLDPTADVTSGEKQKKRKTKKRDDLKMAAMNYESTSLVPTEAKATTEASNLEPAVNVTSGEKKRKKKTKRSDNLEMVTVDNESALSVPTKEVTTNLEPSDNVRAEKKWKKKSKRSDDLGMTTMDYESALLGISATGGHDCQEPVVNKDGATNSESQISESLVTGSLGRQELVPTTKKKRKKTSESKISDLDAITIERNVPSESAVLRTEGTTSENPTASLDLGYSDKKIGKRKKKKKDNHAEVDNGHGSNDKVCEPGEVTVTENVMLDNNESIQPLVEVSIAEQLYAESSLSLEKGEDTVQIKEFKDSDVSGVDCLQALDQTTHTPTQGTVDAKELGKDGENLAAEYARLDLTDAKENSLAIAGQFRYHVLELKKTETCETEKSNDCTNVGKSSYSGGMQRVENGDSLSHGLVEATPSGLLENISSQVDGVSKQFVDLLAEKETINCTDIEPKCDLHLEALPERTLVCRSKKKLLILDVNGILVDFVNYNPRQYKADITISKKYVFKRPYCDEFLQFCFERFNIGVWSSRMKQNMEKAINFLFGDSKEELFLCWDQSHCTSTGLNTLENQSKPLVLKELRKVWEKVEPDLPFEKGEYDETNTLLLDDSPYKALRNPANTAIFPKSYSYTDRDDNALGPGGALRTYLERLSLVDNVQKYVEQNPFGQQAISESHTSWSFYSKIISTIQTSSKL